jgi:transaldolase
MKFFIDTGDVEEIKKAHQRGWVDGVTTNPTLVAKSGKSHHQLIREICEVVKGPVSAEVLALDWEGMVKEGRELAKIADNVVVKVPMTEEGLVAVGKFKAESIPTNVTLIFSPIQALMAAKAGATMASPFVGRLDDVGQNGMELISQIVQIYRNYDLPTQVLVASVRHPIHMVEAALLGAHIATLPFKVMQSLVQHPLTDKGLAQFMKDAKVNAK